MRKMLLKPATMSVLTLLVSSGLAFGQPAPAPAAGAASATSPAPATSPAAAKAPAAAQVVPAAAPSAAPAASRIEQGKYLARAGDCVSCHTAPGGQPFAGGLRLNTPFGYLISPNITPDKETGIGDWSSDDFARAVQRGVNVRGHYLYPVMPFDFYTKASREDIDAIFAYLLTVAPVRNQVAVNHLSFPFDIRASMVAWRELYFKEGAYKPDPKQSASWNRGAYLVEGFGHCSDCHSPRNLLGGIEQSKDQTGAVVDGWFALNLTSDIATGLGSWSVADIATYLKTGVLAGKTTALGPMQEVIQNSTSHLTDADRTAMAEYLKSLPPNSSLITGRTGPDPTKAAGAKLYLDRCSGCHQDKGVGIAGVIPPLAGNPVLLAPDPADVIKLILGGAAAHGQMIAMPGFSNQITNQEVAEISNYVRTSWGNTGAPNATAEGVAKLRKTPMN